MNSKYIIISLFAVFCMTVSSYAQIKEDTGLDLSNIVLDSDEKTLKIDMEVSIDRKNVKPTQVLVLTPYLINGTDSLMLKSIGVYGRNRYFFYQSVLEIDYERIPPTWKSPGNGLTVDKLRKDPSKPGMFIYTVDRHREKERQFGDAGLDVVNKDMNSTKYFSDYGHVMPFAEGVKPNQSGERKRLPFIQSSIAAKGEITISTDPEVVVYQPKTFRIITKPIEGLIKYRKNGVDHDIPKDAFVAFARLMTAARIGVVTIHESGKFELNLREEYKYNWTAGPIEFNYVDNDKTVYECRLDDLATLYTKVKNGETIILTEL